MAQIQINETRVRELFARGAVEELIAYYDGRPDAQTALSADALEYVAIALAQTSGRQAEAESLFLQLLQADPGRLSCELNLGVMYLQASEYSQAKALLEHYQQRLPTDPTVKLNLGLTRFALGEIVSAANDLTEYLAYQPEDDMARIYLARCLVEIDELPAAQHWIEGRTFSNLQSARDQHELSQVYLALGEPAKAELILRQILADSPDDISTRIALAFLFERTNRIEDAQSVLAPVSVDGQKLPHFLLIQSRLHARTQIYDASLGYLQQAQEAADINLSGLIHTNFVSEIEYERGYVLDKTAAFELAFSAFERANALRELSFEALGKPARADLGSDRGLQDRLDLDAAVLNLAQTGAPSEQPIFLVGFPRSGTTLLDQLLDSHPALQVMEEKPALDQVVAELARSPRGYPDALIDLDEPGLQALRNLYWDSVNRSIDRQAGTRLVDKYPFNLARLQLALALFPTAQWIFAIRHPCDVVLSCFMQNLRYTPATSGFTSLGQTARRYRQFVNLWLTQRRRLPIDCLDVRYEHVVADLETEAHRLLDFLGLPWDDTLLDYRQRAKLRKIDTPSYREVVKPIFQTSSGRWQHYQRWLGEAESELGPLIVELGY